MINPFRIFGRPVPNYPTVPLPTALEWIGLEAFPAAGSEEFYAAGRNGSDKQHKLEIVVDQSNGIKISVAEPQGGYRYHFEGDIVYGGKGPMHLRLKTLFMFGREETCPYYKDVETFFKSLHKAMTEGTAPGTHDNFPMFDSFLRESERRRGLEPSAATLA